MNKQNKYQANQPLKEIHMQSQEFLNAVPSLQLMLEMSLKTIPLPTDLERQILRSEEFNSVASIFFFFFFLTSLRTKPYVPRHPFPTPDYYPATPHINFENPALFEKFDTDTLFYIFYYQQGTYQQYLAAKELKKQSWRYHKKYLTWFQRHEEPKEITNDYEQGTYVYFDYETGWCQRKKSEFRFDYRYEVVFVRWIGSKRNGWIYVFFLSGAEVRYECFFVTLFFVLFS